jgi:ATP-dependent protease ClpP protease subunit
MAQRWVVKAHIDDNTCEPCSENNGKLYRNRADAYADYPNGRGYKKCVGAEYGNDCRCRVVKRGKSKGGSNRVSDLAGLIGKAQALTSRVSARNLVPERPSGAPVYSAMQDFRAEGSALYLYDAIGGWDGTKAIDVAQALAGMTGPVDLHINSPGGIIFEGAAMYNVIKSYTNGPVTSWVDGYAASAASFVMLAASPYDEATDTGGVRMAENGFVMVHDGMGLALGTADDMRDVADLLDKLSDSIAAIYAKHAGGTTEEWRDIMRDGDTWYPAQGAKSAGLVNVIVGESAPPAQDPSQNEPEPAPLDLGLFQPVAHATPQNSKINIDPSQLAGLRNALKGAFA